MSEFVAIETLTNGSILATVQTWLPGKRMPLALLAPAAGAQVWVRPRGSVSAVADVWTNPDGTGGPIAQPLVANADGVVAGFVAQPGLLDLHITLPDGSARVMAVGAAGEIRRFDFAFDTPGLRNGVTVYTPKPGDLLLDAWFEITEAWDGTSPLGDIGTYVGQATGLLATGGGAAPLSLAAAEVLGGGYSTAGPSGSAAFLIAGTNAVPGRFTAANPLKVVVSQDGRAGGADPGATKGRATLWLVVA